MYIRGPILQLNICDIMVPRFRDPARAPCFVVCAIRTLIEAEYYFAGNCMSSSGEYNASTSDINIDARIHSPEDRKRDSICWLSREHHLHLSRDSTDSVLFRHGVSY